VTEISAYPEKGSEKRQLLIQIDADLIKRTKIAAVEQRVFASRLVQQALEEFLSRQTSIP
jgi:hypothetical protein